MMDLIERLVNDNDGVCFLENSYEFNDISCLFQSMTLEDLSKSLVKDEFKNEYVEIRSLDERKRFDYKLIESSILSNKQTESNSAEEQDFLIKNVQNVIPELKKNLSCLFTETGLALTADLYILGEESSTEFHSKNHDVILLQLLGESELVFPNENDGIKEVALFEKIPHLEQSFTTLKSIFLKVYSPFLISESIIRKIKNKGKGISVLLSLRVNRKSDSKLYQDFLNLALAFHKDHLKRMMSQNSVLEKNVGNLIDYVRDHIERIDISGILKKQKNDFQNILLMKFGEPLNQSQKIKMLSLNSGIYSSKISDYNSEYAKSIMNDLLNRDLAISDNVNLFHNGLYLTNDHIISGLHTLLRGEFETIIRNHIEGIRKGVPNLSWAPFIGGDVYDQFTENDLFELVEGNNLIENISRLPCSLKLNFVEQYDKGVKKFIDQLSNEYSMSGNCVLFISPPNVDSLAFHIDPCDTVILNVNGEKEWYFPFENENFFFIPEPFDRNHNQHYQNIKKITLDENKSYVISKGTVHRACNVSSGVTIHAAIPLLIENDFLLFKKILEKAYILDAKTFKTVRSEKCVESKIRKIKDLILNQLDTLVPSEEYQEFMSEIEIAKTNILQFGKPHFKKQLIKL